MKVKSLLRSNLLYHGKLYEKNFMDEIVIPEGNKELVEYVTSREDLFEVIGEKAAPEPRKKKVAKPTEE